MLGVQHARRERHGWVANATHSGPLVSLSPAAYSPADVRDRDIDFWHDRAAGDPDASFDRFALAGLLYSRGRATGVEADLVRAEALARESIALRSARNPQAFELLVSVLMARHAFREAHVVAQRADSLSPDTPSHLALLGETELELGDYDEAARHFKAVHYLDGEQFTVGARLARWYEVTGSSDVARAILRKAIRLVDRRDDLPREQVAWFHFRLGELELRTGHSLAADSSYQRGLAINPDDPRLLGGLARSALAQGRWSAAARYGERATAEQLDPGTLGTMSRAYAKLGDSAQAQRAAAAMRASALRQPGALHRAWGLYLLDAGTSADRQAVLARARREIRERHDVYGHDLLAWAYYRTGDRSRARREMMQALAQHTEDVDLEAHARAIFEGSAVTSPSSSPSLPPSLSSSSAPLSRP